MRRTILVSVLLAVPACPSARAEQSAEDILKASGVRGGLVVQLGCDEGKLAAALWAGQSFLVHGLDADSVHVQKAREYIRSVGLGGNVSVKVFDGRHLPYADNLVNLIVIRDPGYEITGGEIERVLAPRGVVIGPEGSSAIPHPVSRIGDGLVKFTKPVPPEIDDWTHYLHGPGNNAVSQDSVVGPPRHFQWISGPKFSRSHDHLASVSAVVSSGGRLFSIVDEGSIAFAGASPRWRLVARDAFNGIRLWQRKMSPWEYHLRDFRSGPADIARRLVAVGDRVYVTLGYGQPVVALNAATGETARTFAGTEGTREIVHYDDKLLLVVGEPRRDWGAQEAKEIVSQEDYRPPFERYTPPGHNLRVMAVAADTGDVLWTNSQPTTRNLMPSTLAVSEGCVFFQNPGAVVCLDAAAGQLQWKAPRPVHRQRLAWSTPTLVVHDGVVYSADRKAVKPKGELLWMPSGGYHEYIRGEGVEGELIAFSAKTGERLWSCPAYEGFNAPVDVMITDGLLWTGRYAWGNDPGITAARDPKTGEVRRRRPPDQDFLPRIGHARCHRAKATPQFVILGRRGVEFVDVKTGNMVANLWVRGICQYGVMPANGLLYVPPHACACSVADMLKSGYMALAPQGRTKEDGRSVREEQRLEKGPAYGEVRGQRSEVRTQESGDRDQESRVGTGDGGIVDNGIPHSAFRTPHSTDWATYRYDAARGGVTPAEVSHRLQTAWQADLGGKLTGPVIAGGRLVVAETDRHYVHALDAASGQAIWTCVAGARIDSPPTIDAGRVLFGSADGCVYCLRLADGKLIWKFRAAPEDRLIVVNGQLESTWPVSGNVLVLGGAAYFAAGRNSYLDGGMFLYKLDAGTGRILKVMPLEIEQTRRDAGFASGGHLPDILSSDGESIFMRKARFDLDLVRQKDDVAHLWSSVGFLDDSWWHRTYWQIGTTMASGWGGWPRAGQRAAAGRLLVTDGSRVFGFGRNQYDIPGAHVGVDGEGVWGPIGGRQSRWTYYHLFRQAVDPQAGRPSRREPAQPAAGKLDWARRVTVLGQAMLLAGETLFVAGPVDKVKEIPHEPAEVDPLAEALEVTRDGRLLAVSAADGKTLADYKLTSPPVFDGMAAANGRLYLSTKSGEVLCMGPAQ